METHTLPRNSSQQSLLHISNGVDVIKEGKLKMKEESPVNYPLGYLFKRSHNKFKTWNR